MQNIRKTKKYNSLIIQPILYIAVHIFISFFFGDIYSLDRIVLTLFLSLTILYHAIFSLKYFNKKILTNPFILFFITTTIMAYTSIYIQTEFEFNQQIFISLSYLLLIVSFYVCENTNISIKKYLNTILFVSVLLVAFVFILSINNSSSITDSIYKSFNNIRIFNHLQVLIIPSLSILLYISKNKFFRVILNFVIASNFIILIDTGARGATTAIVMAFLFFYITNKNNKRIVSHLIQLASMFLSLLAIYYFVYKFGFYSHHTNTEHLLSIDAPGRKKIFDVISNNILKFDYMYSPIGFSSQDIAIFGFMHPHNMFAYSFLGSGSIGMLIFILIFIYYWIQLIHIYFSSKNIVKRYLLIIFVAAFIYSMVSGIYLAPLFSLFFLYYVIILHKYYFYTKIKSKNNAHMYINIILLVSLVIITISSLLKNIELKKLYSYKKDEKTLNKRYIPGILLYTEKVHHIAKL